MRQYSGQYWTLPNPASVVKVVADFEAATGLSLRVVLPNVELK